MENTLQLYFPQLRNRQQVLNDIMSRENLKTLYETWNEEQKNYFLDIVCGVCGVKMLYDSFFKEILNPDTKPKRLEELLSLLLKQKVKILKVLPNDSTRIADESSLLIMDIVVQLEDGSIANVECQKIGYAFPNHIIHRSRQKTDTGLEMELLQEFLFIPLDIAKKIYENNGIRNKLEAWLIFLSDDNPETIMKLIESYPEFREMYEDVYDLCLNTEKVMEMFSKELLELDKNTVQLMIDEMQDEIDSQRERLQEKDVQLREGEQALEKERVENERLRELLKQANILFK